jgi:alpha-L-fucosidase
MKKLILFYILITAATVVNGQGKYEPNWMSIDGRPVPEWFQDAKFGIFIHWGLFSVPAWAPTNVSVYEKYAEWYWKRLLDPKSETYQSLNEFHEKTYGVDFKYQDFVNSFTCELFDPNQWATVFSQSGAKYVVLTSKPT